MSFNSDKFELFRVGKDKSLKDNTLYFTPGYTDMITPTDSLRDLGIQLDEDMKFTSHINKTEATIRQKTGWILRSIQSRDKITMKKLWKTYVLPNIDYCSILWFSPDRPYELKTLEKHQSRFLSRIESLDNSNYWEALKSCNMYSIIRRLERYNIIYTWKSLMGLVPDCGFQLHDESCDSKLKILSLAISFGRVRT